MALLDRAPVVDDRSFDDLVREARSRIQRYATEWTDTNEGDPGFALVQLFAWMSEMLVYRIGRIPERNYLAFLDLIGFQLTPAQPARAEITFPLLANHPRSSERIEPRTQVATEEPDREGRPVVFEIERAFTALRARLDRVWVYDGYRHDQVTRQNAELTGFEPFGRSPADGAAMLLGFDDPLLGEFPSVELDLTVWVAGQEDVLLVGCGSAAASGSPVDIRWEAWDGLSWRPLRVRNDATLGFTRSGHVVLAPPPVATLKRDRMGTAIPDQRFWIRARLAGGAYQNPPRLLAVRTNTGTAIQAETVGDEILGGSDGRPDQELELNERPVIAGSLIVEVDEGTGPRRWTVVEDFLGSTPQSEHVVLDRTSGKVTFGNGVRGRIPIANPASPSASIVAKVYRYGGGKRDNLGPGKITALRSSLPGVETNQVRNPFAASAGSDEEPLRVAMERAQGFLKSRDRAVTGDDFENLALQSGAIARARTLAMYHPDYPGMQLPGVVSVIVVPHGDGPAPMPTAFTLREVCAYLSERRMLTTELFVLAPRYRKLSVRAQLYVSENADPAEVQRAAEAAIERYFHPLHGGAEGTGWPFGGTVYHAVTAHHLMVPDVVRVAELILSIDSEDGVECADVELAPHDLIAVEHDLQVLYQEVRG
jgi:predicted phage baseplate assembly protein